MMFLKVYLVSACCITSTLTFSTKPLGSLYQLSSACGSTRVHFPHRSKPTVIVSPLIECRPSRSGELWPFLATAMDGNVDSSSSSESSNNLSPVKDSLAGLTVAFSLLSKAIACSAIVGVSPLVGLWSSVMMGVTAPIMGSRAGVISGTAAVVTVPLATLTKTHGVDLMPLCILVSAVMQGLFGIFELAKTADLVSEEVLSGFLNGLGFILLFSQASVFRNAAAAGALIPAVSMASLCFAIVQILPLFTKAIPSSLVGLVVASSVGAVLNLPLETLASSATEGTFSGGLSSLPRLIHLSELRSKVTSPAALKLVLPAAISIAIISLVETLLAAKVVDDMTGQRFVKKGTTHAEQTKDEVVLTNYDVPKWSVLALATGNALSALFGGFGGCGLIPQTVLNIKSGGGGSVSSISYAVAMASFVLFFAPLVGKISQAALAGIMITVACDTVAWGLSVKAIKAVINPTKYPDISGQPTTRTQRFIDLLTLGFSSYICYFGNLAIGIILGVVLQRSLFALYNRLRFGYAKKAS